MRTYHANLPTSRATGDWGVGDSAGSHYYRMISVDADGTVWAWDRVARCWTRHHDLAPGQVAEARRLAGEA